MGPFHLTPFLNDHNGFDTYSVLVEADGRRLFYSADFQGHGRKSNIFKEMLRKPPRDVDVMLMEGTNVRGEDKGAPDLSEDEVEKAIMDQVRHTSGMTLVTYSSQNIDRLVTLYRARSEPTRSWLSISTRPRWRKPRGGRASPYPVGATCWSMCRTPADPHQPDEGLRTPRPYQVCPNLSRRARDRRSDLVMTFRMSMARELEKAECLEGASRSGRCGRDISNAHQRNVTSTSLSKHQIPHQIHHASGHAYLNDLKKLAAAVAPQRLVPIHSLAADRFAEHFDHVERHEDGEWWEV